jgi:hypothetical protein
VSASADGCQVRMPDGTLCGWARDGRHLDCAAHRRRLRVHGDYLAAVPVTRKPSRRPEDVAARRAETAERLAVTLERRGAQRREHRSSVMIHRRASAVLA